MSVVYYIFHAQYLAVIILILNFTFLPQIDQISSMSILGVRVVSCHLGAGCSLAASVTGEGSSRDTSMGFSPLSGKYLALIIFCVRDSSDILYKYP